MENFHGAGRFDFDAERAITIGDPCLAIWKVIGFEDARGASADTTTDENPVRLAPVEQRSGVL